MIRNWPGLVSVFTAAAALAVTACGAGGSDAAATGVPEPAPADEWFTDETRASGLDFVHTNGMTGRFYFPEHVAPGVGLLDFDNDGDLDVFFVQGVPLEPRTDGSHSSGAGTGGTLFRNDLTSSGERRSLRFANVTASSGIVTHGYGMGVAVGDVDNDGCPDLYVTNFGPNELFRNNCDGTFTDVSRRSGTDDAGFGVSASFFDFDRDGWLDLFVGNYVQYSVETHVPCRSVTGRLDYCSPQVYRPQPNRLYRNRGDGTFADVTERALVDGDFGPALGAVAADVDADGWPDLFVANDGQPNELWINQHDGTFRNRARPAGVAVNGDGKAVAGMGVDAGDVDNDGDEDLFVTTLTTEMHVLFVNDGHGAFEDQTVRAGLGVATLPYTGWGTAWFDADNDGLLDLLTVNGTIEAQMDGGENHPFPYEQKKQLFHNVGGGRFEEISSRAGAVFQVSEVGRGAAFGDLDNDGAVDVVVANDHGPARLLMNRRGRGRHWVGVRAVGRDAPRDMLGARVGLVGAGGTTVWRRIRADGSYASANDPRVVFGLGGTATPVRVRVIWPDGSTEEWADVPIDRWTTLRKGSAR